MKIVHLNTSDFGGAAMASIQLHRNLLEKGVQSSFLTLNKTRSDVPEHFQVDGFSVSGSPLLNRMKFKARRILEKTRIIADKNNHPSNFNLRKRNSSFEIFSLPYSYFNIYEHPLIQSADIIHLHWVSYGMIDYKRFFTSCKQPVVWTLHDMYPFTGGCHHSDECLGYQNSCSVCPQLTDEKLAGQYWYYKMLGLNHLNLNQLVPVAPSHWLADCATRSSLFKGRACEVIRNGFDTSIFLCKSKTASRQKLSLPENKKIILFNSFDVNNPRKGMEFIQCALKLIHQKDAMLVCIGNSSGINVKEFEIRETGYIIDPDVISDYYAAADIFVLPSVAENFPNTICEAHLCGLPVVAFPVGGVPEQINNLNGILAKAINAEALAIAINAALLQSWNQTEIGETAKKKYSTVEIADKYIELYQKLL